MRKYSLPDTSQRTTNIFLKIFSQNFFSNFFSKYFFPNFFVKIFLKIFSQNFFSKFFCQNFPQNFFSEFFFQIFFVKIFLRIFFQIFFLKIFLKIFSGFVSRVLHARHTRVAITSCETHACFEHPTRNFSRDYINEDFFVKFFFQNFLKIHIITRKIPRGVLATRVCLACETLETNAEKILRKILTKKFGKKIWKKILRKYFEENFDKKIWKKNLKKNFVHEYLRNI